MATVAVLADPPVEGVVLPDVVRETPLSATDATQLYSAMLADITRIVQAGGADLLVNYPPAEEFSGAVDPEAQLRDLLADTLEDPAAARYEVQVGSSMAARVGNTVTHLLEEEGERTASMLRPTAPFLTRASIGGAAMKLRSSDVVLGPAGGGRVYFAGFGEPVDFTDAFDPPAVETLAQQAHKADHSVDFLEMRPVVETGADLVTTLAQLRARKRAERIVPAHTAAVVEDLGLTLDEEAAGLAVAYGSDRS